MGFFLTGEYIRPLTAAIIKRTELNIMVVSSSRNVSWVYFISVSIVPEPINRRRGIIKAILLVMFLSCFL